MKRGALLACALLAAGTAPACALDFERFFDGRLVGRGTVDNRKDGTHRAFTAAIDAHWSGPHGTLTEVLTYADGEVKRLAWTFDRTGPGRYTGHREDLVGEADVSSEGDELRMRYTAHTRLPSGSVWRLGFDDHFRQTGPGTVTLEGTVTYLFIGVGATHMIIDKVTQGSAPPR